MVQQEDLFQRRHVASADQTDSGDGVRGTEQAGGSKGRTPSGESRYAAGAPDSQSAWQAPARAATYSDGSCS